MTTEELKDDIQYIRQIIQNNQRALIDNGVMFITNGIFVLIGFALTFLLGRMGLGAFIPALWIIIVLLMIVVNVILPQRIDPNLPKKIFASKILQVNFAATGVPMVVLMLLFFFMDGLSLSALLLADAALFGVMFFMHGTILNLNMMKGLAFVWWLYMILAVFWGRIGEPYQLALIFVILAGALQLIPGIVIYRKWRDLYADKQF